MKTFKTRSSAMNRAVVESMDNYGSHNVSISSSPSSSSSSSSSRYILFLDKIDYNCIEDPFNYGTICRGTIFAAYFFYLSQNIDIFLNKSAFTSDNLDKLDNVIAIFILDKLYTVEYKGRLGNLYIKYTINYPKDALLDNLDKIRETNKQVVVDKNNTTQGDRGFYQIFTDKGKVRILG